jgi:hypothetical protein
MLLAVFLALFAPIPTAFAQTAGSGIAMVSTPLPDYLLWESTPLLGNPVDGRADPGEGLYLDIRIQNLGQNTITGLQAELSISGNFAEYVHIERGQVNLGSLEAGWYRTLTGGPAKKKADSLLRDTRGLKDAFLFFLAADCPTVGSLPFTVRFRDSQGKTWTETLNIPVSYTSKFNLGRISFSMTPKILENGTLTDYSLGYRYAERFAVELRTRFTEESYNAPLYEDMKSLVATDNTVYEFFILPLRYYFYKNAQMKFGAGAGAYYEYNEVKQEGYFNNEDWPAGFKLNTYDNDFSMSILGPLADLGFSYRTENCYFSISGGIMPVFSLWRDQSQSMAPFMIQETFDFSQQTSGGPYLYFDLSAILFRYVYLALAYEYTKLQYGVIVINDRDKWKAQDENVISMSFKLEAALLVPLGANISFQIGYGHSFDSIGSDTDSLMKSEQDYFICGVKKLGF